MSRKNLKKMWIIVMALVMLMGNSLSVLAASYNVNDLSVGQELQNGDEVYFTNIYYTGQLDIYVNNTHQIEVNYPNSTALKSDSYRLTSRCRVQSVTVMEVDSSSPDPAVLKLEVLTGSATPSTKPGKSEHHHNFQWKIVKDPTLREDGLAQSVCECGAVEAQQPVSSGTAFINMVRDKIEAAPEGGTVEISSELYFCYTAKIMKALQARPDVSLKTNYLTEDGTWHTFTIPAGSAPSGDTQFYGFTGLANYYNGGSGDCDHVHDEVCGGEENCEHVHDEDCDIEEDCEHIHDEACGGEENCEHVHDENCDTEEDCEHIHDEACGYVEGTDAGCTHVHNEDC